MTEKAVARIGDHGVGTCTLHDTPQAITVTFTTGCPTVFADGVQVCTVGSQGLASCGHTTTAVTGSSVSFAGGQAIHRIGDTGTTGGGSYTVTTGSPNVFSQ